MPQQIPQLYRVDVYAGDDYEFSEFFRSRTIADHFARTVLKGMTHKRTTLSAVAVAEPVHMLNDFSAWVSQQRG